MKIYSWYFWSWSLLNHISIQNRLSLKRGTRNGERGMRLTIFHEILHSEQFEGTEFIDDDSFVWFLTPANGGRCHLSGHSFGRRAVNASILMKFCTLNKCRTVNSMVTNFFYKFWCLPILKSVNVGTCHLLGHGFGSFEWRTANVSILMKFHTRQVEGGEFNSNNSFLWFSMPVKFDTCGQNLTNLTISTCDPFFHSFGPKMANLPILMKLCTLHKLSPMNSIVTIVFWDSWRLSILTIVSIGTCYLLGHGFRPKTTNASVLIKFCTLHKTRVVNSMVSILRDASGCRRKIKLRIEKQILCQKYYCYIISKTGKKLWPTSAKLHS